MWHGIFGGLNFGLGVILGFDRVLIFAPIRSSLSLEIRNIPPPPKEGETRGGVLHSVMAYTGGSTREVHFFSEICHFSLEIDQRANRCKI